MTDNLPQLEALCKSPWKLKSFENSQETAQNYTAGTGQWPDERAGTSVTKVTISNTTHAHEWKSCSARKGSFASATTCPRLLKVCQRPSKWSTNGSLWYKHHLPSLEGEEYSQEDRIYHLACGGNIVLWGCFSAERRYNWSVLRKGWIGPRIWRFCTNTFFHQREHWG